MAPEEQVAGCGDSSSTVSATTGGGAGNAGANSSGGTGELLAEAASLLRSLRHPSMNAAIVMKQVGAADSRMGLLDGGATHALRPWKTAEEWNQAELVEVCLADGSRTLMRSKPGTLTLLAEKGTQIIVRAMMESGYVVNWVNGKRSVAY